MNQTELVSRYKTDGHFNENRKTFLETFQSDAAIQQTLNELLDDLIRLKITKDPYLLTKNKGKISALIQTELVKRQVVREKKEKKTIQSAAKTNAAKKIQDDENGNKKPLDRETELLDQINDLMYKFADNLNSDEKMVADMLGKLGTK